MANTEHALEPGSVLGIGRRESAFSAHCLFVADIGQIAVPTD